MTASLRPFKPLSSGRYTLDRDGNLGPITWPNLVRAVVMVRVRCKAASIAPKRKISLTDAPSSMEQRAASWRGGGA